MARGRAGILDISCQLLCAVLLGCATTGAGVDDSPLAVVVKLLSAEESADYESALRYLDVESAYGPLATGEKSAEDVWRERVSFSYNLGTTKKFTNQFRYHHYTIREWRTGRTTVISFDHEDGKLKIVYRLRKDRAGWKVVEIAYHRAESGNDTPAGQQAEPQPVRDGFMRGSSAPGALVGAGIEHRLR